MFLKFTPNMLVSCKSCTRSIEGLTPSPSPICKVLPDPAQSKDVGASSVWVGGYVIPGQTFRYIMYHYELSPQLANKYKLLIITIFHFTSVSRRWLRQVPSVLRGKLASASR